jgi:hypothetical protein
MQQANQLTEEQDAAQQYVSSEELVRALASIESQHIGESADRLKIGDAIQQLGLDVTPDQILAEIEAQRTRQSTVAADIARRKRAVRSVAISVTVALVIVMMFSWLGARSSSLRLSRLASFPSNRNLPTGFGPEFDSLMRTFRANTFDEGKVAFTKVMAQGRSFSEAEVHLILSDMTFDRGRVDAAVILYPHMTDKQNAYRLLDTMTFDQGRKELIERLGLDKP